MDCSLIAASRLGARVCSSFRVGGVKSFGGPHLEQREPGYAGPEFVVQWGPYLRFRRLGGGEFKLTTARQLV